MLPCPAHHYILHTTRTDGIPVPALNLFMTGYKKLFKLYIPSKTLDNSYLVMNKQVWTNEKTSLSRIGSGLGGVHPEESCKLCGNKEDTMHFMFDCEIYSEPFWAIVGNIIKETVNRESKGEEMFNSRLHAFLVMYNVTAGVPAKHINDIMTLIQQI
jgi:hypothetical protein